MLGNPTTESGVRGRLAPWLERRAKDIMRAHLDGALSIAQLAAECGLSRSHFARSFKRTTGTPPHRWLLAQRIAKATELLLKSESSITDIALACGFADQSHFTRIFVASVGMSPGAWRRVRKAWKAQQATRELPNPRQAAILHMPPASD